MTLKEKEKIIEHYAGYVDIILSEGENLTLEQAIEYACNMFKEDTTKWKDCRANRFIGLEKLKCAIREKIIEMGLK